MVEKNFKREQALIDQQALMLDEKLASVQQRHAKGIKNLETKAYKDYKRHVGGQKDSPSQDRVIFKPSPEAANDMDVDYGDYLSPSPSQAKKDGQNLDMLPPPKVTYISA